MFENLETGIEISKGSLTELPHEFTNLIPYTFYKVTISKGAMISLFSQEVRTLHEGSPVFQIQFLDRFHHL